MDFIAAPLLWGLAAAGVPVLLHLLGRTKPLPHRFPALRFILRSQRSSSRALRLKHLLVLLLRIAALVVVVLALARPLWSSAPMLGTWIGAGAVVAALAVWALYRGEIAAGALGLLLLAALYMSFPSHAARAALQGDFVLVLDQSMSMSYVEPEGTRFDLARQQALQFLDGLAPDARVALLLATEKVERAPGRLTYRHEIVRQKILDAHPTGRGLDLAAALQAAREVLLRNRRSGVAAVVLLTDLQANSITALSAKQTDKRTAEQPRVPRLPLIVGDVGSEQARNGAALSARLPGSVMPADTTVTLSGKVKPVDNDHPCLVELYVDDRRVVQKLVQPKGQDTVDVALEFQTGRAGVHWGRLHLPDSDRLPMDQDFMFVYESGRPASALLVEAPGAAGAKGTAFFLQAALQPEGQAALLGTSGLSCTTQPAGELSAETLAQHRVVVLADCGPLSASSWAALQRWTNDGGGLFVWLGPRTDPADVRAYGFQPFAKNGGLLPGHIGKLVAPEKPEAIGIVQPEHPLLAHVTPGIAALLREVQVKSFTRITPEARDPDCSVVLQLSDGSPLLLEKPYGRGRVVLWAMGPELQGSDLPRHGEAFVTVVLDSIRVLADSSDDLKARLGFPLVLSLAPPPGDGQLLWKLPGMSAPVVLRVDTSARAPVQQAPAPASTAPATVIVPPLDVPGIHEFRWAPADSRTTLVKLVAINPDTAESDMTKASRKAALQAFSSWDAAIEQHIGASSALGGNVAEAGKREAAAGLLLALLALLLAETFLSNRLYRADSAPEGAAAAQRPASAEGVDDAA